MDSLHAEEMTLQRRPDEAEFTWDVMMPVWIAHVTPPLLLVLQEHSDSWTMGADAPRRLSLDVCPCCTLAEESGRAVPVLLWQGV